MKRKKKISLPPRRLAPKPAVMSRMILTFEIESKCTPEDALRAAHTALIVNEIRPLSMGVVLETDEK